LSLNKERRKLDSGNMHPTICDIQCKAIKYEMEKWYNLKSTLANVSAATHTCKQWAVTFEVLFLWLCNQH